ncbi:hypothetical protein BRDID11002_19210 [Bradyrhizobium diazoefficiens]
MLGSHEAAQAHAVAVLERLAKDVGIAVQAAQRIRGFRQHGFERRRGVLPVAPGDRCAEIGLAREMIVDARGLDADLSGEIAEVQAAIAVRLCGASGGRPGWLPVRWYSCRRLTASLSTK